MTEDEAESRSGQHEKIFTACVLHVRIPASFHEKFDQIHGATFKRELQSCRELVVRFVDIRTVVNQQLTNVRVSESDY